VNEQLFLPGGLLTIVLASAVTYAMRLGGLLLADRLPRSGPVRRFLDALPGTILVSLVFPGALQFGTPGLLGLAACLTAYWASRNILLTMVAGVIMIWSLRQFALF
jgi:uncharacterized membrane protein